MNFKISDIIPMPCIKPSFNRGIQTIITSPGVTDLQNGASVIVMHNIMSDTEIQKYLESAVNITRLPGKSGYGKDKTRLEMCYSAPGDPPFRYSGRIHPTIPYPEHVSELSKTLLTKIKEFIPDNVYTKTSYGVDIMYSDEFKLDGGIRAHSDIDHSNKDRSNKDRSNKDHSDWGLVMIFMLGQSRWMRIRHKITKDWTNVLMTHNSVIAMYGKDFQQDYTHQIDKLNKKEPVGIRLSLNFRFLPDLEDHTDPKDNTDD